MKQGQTVAPAQQTNTPSAGDLFVQYTDTIGVDNMPTFFEFERMYNEGGAAWDELSLRKRWKDALQSGEIEPFTSFEEYQAMVDGQGESGYNENSIVEVSLKYKEGWTEAQRTEAKAKIDALSKVELVKTTPKRSGTSAASRYKSVYGNISVPVGYDVDHIIDLQLGGADKVSNLKPLEMSVNRSLGAQIMNAIRLYKYGTKFKFTISD